MLLHPPHPNARQQVINMYQKAWTLLLKRIEQKTSWGKNELKQLMLECIVKAGE